MALALAGVALALAFPALTSRPLNLPADLQDLSKNLEVARELAISHSVHYHLAVAASGPPYQYLIEHCSSTVVPCPGWITERTITLRPGVQFDAATLGATAEFDTRGDAVSGAAMITSPVVLTLVDATGNSKQVTVDPVGMVDAP